MKYSIINKKIFTDFFLNNNILICMEKDYSQEEYFQLLNQAQNINCVLLEFIKYCLFEENQDKSYNISTDYESFDEMYDYFLSFYSGYSEEDDKNKISN